MPLTDAQIAKKEQKEAQMPDALRRDPNVDYTEGWFFVTLNTRDDVPVLSTCEGNPAIPDGQPGAPYCRYTRLGRGVVDVWKSIPDFHKGVEIDLFEAMPEHIHGLIHLLPENRQHLGTIIGGFMGGCSHAYWDTLGIDWRTGHPTQGKKMATGNSAAAQIPNEKGAAAQKPIDRDRDHTHSFRGPALFVHGFNDTIPLSSEEVEVKRAYIRDQARKRLIQGDRHACFQKVRHQHTPSWTEERVWQAILNDRSLAYDPQKQEDEIQHVLERLNWDSSGAGKVGIQNDRIGLDYIGPRKLLYAERKLPLVCHRADLSQFEQQKLAVLQAAREGAVIVSAFISQKERDIRDQLIAELLPFIEVTDYGYSNKYKGIGKAFYALAEQRLLQISPWKYQYEKDGVHVTRGMCDVMNELARVICKTPDDWWKT